MFESGNRYTGFNECSEIHFDNTSIFHKFNCNFFFFFRLVPIEYYLTRVEGSFAILDRLDIISTTSELARVFGIQFYQVLARGSQVNLIYFCINI